MSKAKARSASQETISEETRKIYVGAETEPVVRTTPLVITSHGISVIESQESTDESFDIPLSDGERRLRIEMEAVIEKGLKESMQVAKALFAIHSGKLYRDQFSTFEKYLGARWGIGRAYGYRLLDAGLADHVLSTSGDTPAVETVNQMSKLGRLKDAKEIRAVNESAKIASAEGKSAAATVDASVQRKKRSAQSKPKAAKQKKPDAQASTEEERRNNANAASQADGSSGHAMNETFARVYRRVNRVLRKLDDDPDIDDIHDEIRAIEELLRPYFAEEEMEEAA